MNGHTFSERRCRSCGIDQGDYYEGRDMLLFGGTSRAMNRNECVGAPEVPK